jgi:uncharacterized protein YndB with AHSA1/START domain
MADTAPAAHELSVTRLIQAPPETVYRIWTERTGEWFVPRPWTMPVVEMDFRPGGRSYIEMESPEGERFPNDGVFLEVVPNERIVSTDAFTPGWVPQGPFMVAIFTFEPEGGGTNYTARVRHWTAEALKQHQDMGFEQGWSQCAAQLAELAEAEAGAD